MFRFGPFEVNEASGELRKHGTRIKLHAQPFQVLLMLLEKPAELVTREEMRQRLWGSGTFVDFDHGLNTAINKLREALGDSAAQPRHIETVPGKGYRFIAPVMSSAPPAPPKAVAEAVAGKLLTTPADLPRAPRSLVRSLLALIEGMYLAFYIGALANLAEIHDIFVDAQLASPRPLMAVLIITSAVLIPVRLFLGTAIAFDTPHLQPKFKRLFPFLLPLDLAWALSPLLLIHHIPGGLALAICATLVYVPFAQRSLILMLHATES